MKKNQLILLRNECLSGWVEGPFVVSKDFDIQIEIAAYSRLALNAGASSKKSFTGFIGFLQWKKLVSRIQVQTVYLGPQAQFKGTECADRIVYAQPQVSANEADGPETLLRVDDFPIEYTVGASP